MSKVLITGVFWLTGDFENPQSRGEFLVTRGVGTRCRATAGMCCRTLVIMKAMVVAVERTGNPGKGILCGQFMSTAKGAKGYRIQSPFW